MPAGSWQIDPLIQDAKDSRGRAPDITLGKRHRVIEALHAAEFRAVDLVVRRIHQEGERHLESVIDLAFVDPEFEPGLDPGNRRQDAKSEAGSIEIEIADRPDEFALQSDFLIGFAQGRIEWRGVGHIDLAAGKGNLAGMFLEMPR